MMVTSWTDDPLSKEVPCKAQHVNELRAAIEAVPGIYTPPWGFGGRVDSSTAIKAQHLLDLRAAIGPGSGGLSGVLRAAHVDDLRRWFNTSETGVANYQFPQLRPMIFGMNPSWAEWQQNPQYTNDTMMAKMRDAGATCIRSGIDWQSIQPNGHGTPYIWDTYDARISLAQKYGLLWIADVGTAPNWATGNTTGSMPPLSQYTADFQQFVTAVAQRYLGQIRHYEFVNEPNGGGWNYPSGTGNVAKGQMYESWLQMFYQAIKAVDSTAWVSTGGIDNLYVGNGLDFINGIYSVSGAKQYFAAVAGHPYNGNNQQNGPMDTTDIQNLRQIIANNGDTFKPIWITEYGWDVDSNPNSITPAQQQSYLQQALDFLANAADNYVTIATFLIIADIYGPNNANTIMGLCDQSLSARPACSTFASYSKPTT